MPTNQPPPHSGWKFDEESRGWYSPNYRTFLEAKAKGHQETREKSTGVAWVSRRVYDEKYGRLKGTTYERAGKERRSLGVTPDWHRIVNTRAGEVYRTNWYSQVATYQEDINRIIAGLRPGQRMMVVAYGKPSRYYTYEDQKRARYVYRTVLKANDVQSYRAQNLNLAPMGHIEHYEVKVEFP